MTTNVFDRSKDILACDSRWSGSEGGYLFYVDNVGYEKIVFDSRIALLFAGDLDIIDAWKAWFKSGRYAPAPHTTGKLSLCIVDLMDGSVPVDHGMKLDSACKLARFAGTGSPHALNAWSTHGDALLSVETACSLDMQSGGNVAHLSRVTKENNLNNVSSAQELLNSFLPNGEMIMLNGNQKQSPVKISEGIKDPAANEAFHKMMAGGLSGVCAPFTGMGTPWTEEEVSKLYATLASYPPERS